MRRGYPSHAGRWQNTGRKWAYRPPANGNRHEITRKEEQAMSSSDALKWLNENFNFVDSVTIIDHSGTIIAKQRFNPRYTDEENAADNQWALGKNLLEVFPGCRVCGHRDLSPDRNGNGEIEPEEWMKACPCFDAEQEFKEFAAEDTEETQSKLNYLKNKKGGK